MSDEDLQSICNTLVRSLCLPHSIGQALHQHVHLYQDVL